MVNAWSLLYDAMEDDKLVLNYDRDPVVDYDSYYSVKIGEDNITINTSKYKYEEDQIVKELLEYISNTYNQH